MINFVGAGPGAVDLITIRAHDLIKNADVIIYAGSLVNPEILKYAGKEAKVYDSSRMTLEEVTDLMRKADEEGLDVVRLHTGDQSVYGAVREQMDVLDEWGIEYGSCPGVTAAFGAAADLGLEYTLPGVTQTLIITRMEGRTAVPEAESIESLASHGASMAIYLSAGMLDRLSEQLIKGGYEPSTPAAIVYKATWPEEEIYMCTVGELCEVGRKYGITRTAVILVGAAVGHREYLRSRLYDPSFTTGYRQGREG